MELITIPSKLRLNKLQSLAQTALDLCKNHKEVEKAYKQVVACLSEFNKGMQKDQASAEDKPELDKARDKIFSGFKHALSAENLYPQSNKQILSELQQLNNVYEKYGPQLYKLSYNEESAALDNLIADIEKLNLEHLQDSSVMRWIPLLKRTNDQFKLSAIDYISSSAELENTDSATEYAPALEKALKNLFIAVYTEAFINNNSSLEQLYFELNKLSESYY